MSLQYTEPPSAQQARVILDGLAALRPDLVVSAQFDPVRYADWILRRLSPVRAAGFEGGTWQEVPGARALEHELWLPPSRPLDLRVACDAEAPEVEKNAKLLAALVGRELAVPRPRLKLPGAVEERGREHLAGLGLRAGQYVACCPAGTANVELKAWAPQRFASMASWLSGQRRVPVLVMGHRSEASTVDAVLRMAEGPNLHRFVGDDGDFELMTSLLALARLYLGNDTGPMHLAAAAGVPVVAVFGGGHWPRFLPAAETGAVHTQDLPCFGCGWRDCIFGDAPCVGHVEEARVRDSVARVLDGGRGLEVVRQAPISSAGFRARALAGYRALSDEAARRLDGLLSRNVKIARPDLTARHTPLLSIVTPTLDAARWLERCILSVRDQDYPRVEHIIVDGGSSDGTLEICARYPHLVVDSASDRGQSHALNRGFGMARGDVLAWLCADDEYLPGAFSAAVDAVRAGNGLVVGNCQFIDAEGRQIAAHAANASSSIDYESVLRFWNGTLPQPAIFWQRRLWERCGPLREDLRFAMDYDLWLRMTRVAPVKHVGTDVALYRIHPDAKCFADNYGSRLELLEVSRSYWPPRWHPGHWELALDHWLSGRDITRHYTEAERLRDRAFRELRVPRRLAALMAFARMHALHPKSPALPHYGRLVRTLIGSLVPAPCVPLAEAAVKRWRRKDRVAA